MRDTSSTLYAIGVAGSPLVKIGWTKGSALKRLKVLQTGQPSPLHLLAEVPMSVGKGCPLCHALCGWPKRSTPAPIIS